MPVRIRRARKSADGSASKDVARQDDLLAFVDQAFFAGHRAAGQKDVMQIVWTYEHAVDWEGLQRFRHNLGHGLLGRRIERSPLPFGRYRWVLDRGPSDFDIAECARPRSELSDWADECSQLPIDPEWGPGWRLDVLPLTDGAVAISLVASHYLLDGIGLVIALVDALTGTTRDLGYLPPRSRTRFRAVREDARQTFRDLPRVGRALVAAPKLVRLGMPDQPDSPASSQLVAVPTDGDEPVIVPGVSIYVDIDVWDARAAALGGTSSTLVAALAAKLGEHLGHRHDNGAVTVQLVMSDRTEGDARAVAVSLARVHVDPTLVTTDLTDARTDIKKALQTLREMPHESSALESLAPFTPKWTWRRAVERAFADPDRPVICSNVGDVGMVVNRLDGTDAEYAFARGTRQQVTRRWLERIGGQTQLLSFRIPRRVVIHVLAYHPGIENTKAALREMVARAMAEFDLTAEID
jgi:hypothetical protein